MIGLVTDGGYINDNSFNQLSLKGVQEAANEIDAEFYYIETEEAKNYEINIQHLIDDGANVIVTVGFAMSEATIEAAIANTNIMFIGVDQYQTEAIPNLAGLVFKEENAGFLAGALAGMLTKSNIVGTVLATDLVEPIVLFKQGWEHGVKYTNPSVKTISTYHPGGIDVAFMDPEWGAIQARDMLDQGADIIFGVGGKTGNGALIEVANEKGALCVGVDTDKWKTLPEAHSCLITSAIKRIDIGVASMIIDAYEGVLKGGNFYGEVGLAPYHNFESIVTTEMREKLDGILAGLTDKSISNDIRIYL